MNKSVLILAILLVATSLLLGACSSSSSPSSPNQSTYSFAPVKTPTATLVPQNSNLVNGIITVNSGDYYYTSFTVTDSMRDVSIQGLFTASGGSGNDIIVLVLDNLAYTNWINGHSVITLYNSGQITTANMNVSINTSGQYYLVFSNKFSIISSKKVNANINLKWSEMQYK